MALGSCTVVVAIAMTGCGGKVIQQTDGDRGSSGGNAGSGGAGGSATTDCALPPPPYGLDIGATADATLSWQGYPAGESTEPTTLFLKDYLDCDGTTSTFQRLIRGEQIGDRCVATPVEGIGVVLGAE